MTSMYGDDPTQRLGPVEPPTPIDPYALPPGYGQPAVGSGYPGQPPPAARTANTMAILSLVFAFVFWPLAIIFGHIGKRQIERTGEAGSGLATAGLVIAYLWLGLTVCVCCGGLFLLPQSGGR